MHEQNVTYTPHITSRINSSESFNPINATEELPSRFLHEQQAQSHLQESGCSAYWDEQEQQNMGQDTSTAEHQWNMCAFKSRHPQTCCHPRPAARCTPPQSPHADSSNQPQTSITMSTFPSMNSPVIQSTAIKKHWSLPHFSRILCVGSEAKSTDRTLIPACPDIRFFWNQRFQSHNPSNTTCSRNGAWEDKVVILAQPAYISTMSMKRLGLSKECQAGVKTRSLASLRRAWKSCGRFSSCCTASMAGSRARAGHQSKTRKAWAQNSASSTHAACKQSRASTIGGIEHGNLDSTPCEPLDQRAHRSGFITFVVLTISAGIVLFRGLCTVRMAPVLDTPHVLDVCKETS